MPPKATDPVQYSDWIDNIFRLPIDAPRQTVAILKDQVYRDLVMLRLVVRPTDSVSSSNLKMALAEGPEQVSDMAGVQTTLRLTQVVTDPKKAMQSALIQTLVDIKDLNELNQIKRQKTLGNLTKGIQTDEDEINIEEYGNWRLKNIVQPLITGAPPSLDTGTETRGLQLVINKPVHGSLDNKYVDRRTAETGEEVKNRAHDSYTELANALTNLGGQQAFRPTRIQQRNLIVQNFNRSVARELGIDLDTMLGHEVQETGKKTTYKKGRLNAFMEENRRGPESDLEIAEVLGMSLDDFQTYKPQTQEYFRKYTAGEVLGLKHHADPYLHKTIKEQTKTQLGLDLDNLPNDLPDDIQSAWKKFSSPNMSAEDRRKAYEKLQQAYWHKGRIKEWQKVNSLDYGMELGGTKYKGLIRSKKMFEGDLQFEYEKQLIWGDLWFDLNSAQIRADILEKNEDGTKALARIKAAKTASDLGQDLFYSATAFELLEAIDKGSLTETAVIISRFAATAPFLPRQARELFSYTTNIDLRNYTGEIAKEGFKMTGLAFESDKHEGVTGWAFNKVRGNSKAEAVEETLFKNRHWHQYQLMEINPDSNRFRPSGRWKELTLDHDKVNGLFGDNSVFGLLNEAQDKGALGDLPTLRDANNIVGNKDHLEGILAALQKYKNTEMTDELFNSLSSDYERLIFKLGLNDPDNLKKADGLIKNFQAVLDPDSGAYKWLESTGLDPNQFWHLLISIEQAGIGKSLAENKYIGLLTQYNRYANKWRDKLYKQFIWGKAGDKIPLVNRLRGFLKGLGVSEEPTMIMALQQRRIFRRARLLGKALQSSAVGKPHVSKMLLGGTVKKVVGKLAASSIGKVILLSFGKLALVLSGTVTAGISWVLTLIGETTAKVLKNLVRLDIQGAKAAIKEDAVRLVNMGKKLFWYPIRTILACFCSCCAFIFFVPIALMGVMLPGTMAPYEEQGGISSAINSEKLAVSKAASQGTNNIIYSVKISNITSEEVQIGTVNDRVRMIPDCNINSGNGVSPGDSLFVGSLNPSDPIAGVSGTVLPPNGSIDISYVIENISSDNVTYTNFIEVTAVGEANRSATGFTNTKIKDGGCAVCPAEWPVVGGITQGPNTLSGTHVGTEAIDISATVGTNVVATHPGTAVTGFDPGGYGSYVKILSDQTFETLYGHLSVVAVSNGDPISTGQIIGQVGSTGNSTGPHLHYEFRQDSSGAIGYCNGQPLRMEPPFIPPW